MTSQADCSPHRAIDGATCQLPAIAEENDALGREPGTYLWDDDPKYAYGHWLRDRQAEYELNAIGTRLGESFSTATVLATGNFFKVDRINIIDGCDNLTATRPVRA